MYLYGELTNDKIPQHIKDKIEKDLDFTEAEEREMLDIIKIDKGLKQITYKGTTHLYNYDLHTDCGLSVPLQGNHLKSIKKINNLNEVTCENCLSTLSVI